MGYTIKKQGITIKTTLLLLSFLTMQVFALERKVEVTVHKQVFKRFEAEKRGSNFLENIIREGKLSASEAKALREQREGAKTPAAQEAYFEKLYDVGMAKGLFTISKDGKTFDFPYAKSAADKELVSRALGTSFTGNQVKLNDVSLKNLQEMQALRSSPDTFDRNLHDLVSAAQEHIETGRADVNAADFTKSVLDLRSALKTLAGEKKIDAETGKETEQTVAAILSNPNDPRLTRTEIENIRTFLNDPKASPAEKKGSIKGLLKLYTVYSNELAATYKEVASGKTSTKDLVDLFSAHRKNLEESGDPDQAARAKEIKPADFAKEAEAVQAALKEIKPEGKTNAEIEGLLVEELVKKGISKERANEIAEALRERASKKFLAEIENLVKSKVITKEEAEAVICPLEGSPCNNNQLNDTAVAGFMQSIGFDRKRATQCGPRRRKALRANNASRSGNPLGNGHLDKVGTGGGARPSKVRDN